MRGGKIGAAGAVKHQLAANGQKIIPAAEWHFILAIKRAGFIRHRNAAPLRSVHTLKPQIALKKACQRWVSPKWCLKKLRQMDVLGS